MTELEYYKGFVDWLHAKGKATEKDASEYDQYVRLYNEAKKVVDEMMPS